MSFALLLGISIAIPARAQIEFVRAPIASAGPVTLQAPWDNVQVSIPFVEALPGNTNCATGTFSIEIVDGNALEVGLQVSAVSLGGACINTLNSELDLTVTIPELGTASTAMLLQPIALPPVITQLDTVTIAIEPGTFDPATSQKIGRIRGLPFSRAEISWVASGSSIATTPEAGPATTAWCSTPSLATP